MEAQIHNLEQEAYCSVLRAFKAQADAITWDKESLITELRKELRVSDDEHREFLARVNSDNIIREIREWRQAGGHLNVRCSSSQPVHDVVPCPTVSASRKKQKTSQLGQNALVYDINTACETWECVDIKGIPPDDIRWDTVDPGMTHRGGHGGQSRVYRRSQSLSGFAPGTGSGRGHSKSQSRKELSPSQNGVGKKELLNTEALVKEVEKVFNASNPDPAELEKAKKMLKDHEQALVDAISKLTYASDGESEGAQPNVHGQLVDKNNDS